jgi:hypothetical protein
LGKYPYFTNKVSYDLSQFKSYSRRQIIDTFFDKARFYAAFFSDNVTTIPDETQRNHNAKHNVMVMLQLLFPTSFPIRANMHDTFLENIKKETTDVPESMSLLPNFINELIGSDEKNQFCYIQHSSGIFTVMEVFWINDVINQPEYLQLFRTLLKSVTNANRDKRQREIRLNDIKMKFAQLYTTFYSKFNDSKNATVKASIIKYSDNASGRISKGIDPKLVNDILNKLPPSTGINDDNIDDIIGMWFQLYNLKIDASKYNSDPNIIPPELTRSFSETLLLLDLASEYERITDATIYISDYAKYKGFMNKKTANMTQWDLEIRDELLKRSKISDIFNKMKQYIPPVRSCSNKKLQALINSIARQGLTDESNQTNIQYIIDLSKNGISAKNGDIDTLEVGVVSNHTGVASNTEGIQNADGESSNKLTESDEEYYDIYINVNCIKGILDKKNIPLIKCSYENSNLVRIYNHLKHPILKKNPMLLYSDFPIINIESLMPKNTRQNTKRRSNGSSKRRTRRLQTGGYKPKGSIKGRSIKGSSIKGRSPKSASV